MANVMTNLTVLSAMITPAVLILATGSLLLTTSQRLSRCIERARKLSVEIDSYSSDGEKASQESLYRDQLLLTAQRARMLQRSMVCLYTALALFVGCSISMGLLELTHMTVAWIPVSLGLIGALLLLAASGLLIAESRTALRAVTREMVALIRHHSKDRA